MRVALPIVAAATLLCTGCYLPFEGEAHFIYGSNLDVPGDNLLIWPVDEYGNAFRRTTQLSEGLRMLSEGHVFTMPHTGDWRMAGSVELEGVVVILPPDPGPELRERASEISAGVSRAYPRASVHLVKTRIEPYGLESVGQLEAKLRDAWYEHMGTRSRFMTDAIASEVGRELSVLAVAEFVILPLAGEEIRYAVVTPSPEGQGNGLSIREATSETIVQVLRELAVEARAARAAWAESDDDAALLCAGNRTGRVRAILPLGAPDEVRRTLEDVLFELQEAPLPRDPTNRRYQYSTNMFGPWMGAEGLELRYATSVRWGDPKTIEEVDENGRFWLLLYFSP